eukprot:GFUD01002912.1.p1 GENE.GFUD01002912.1~~GFUD01002912.1.p1  ORF type:complete len:475 (-),score=120.62 GFUD01002912.1:110-1534(-)
MAHLLSDLANYFTLDEINIDNWTFKLYYKVSMVICMTGATVGIASQYFGDPISCEFQGISSDLAQDYCWIHGSSYIPPQYQAHVGCIVDLDGIESADDAPDTSYYQWVTFMFAIQAAIFFFPYKVWHAIEGGLIASFGTDGKTPIMISEDAKYDDGVVQEAVIEKFVKYFKSIFHHNSWYFASYVFCEFLNFSLLGLQFLLTDKFLNNKFMWYGWSVVQYYSWSRKDRMDKELGLKNPMCTVFPTVTSCSIPNVGAAGSPQVHNGMCVLTQNIINEKIYLVLWFWYSFLGPVSVLYMCYRLITIFFHGVRFSLLYRKVRRKYDDDIRRCLEYVLAKGQIGDWFVLYQLSKNCNPYFFREFIRELAMEMSNRPKKSKYRSSSIGEGTLKRQNTITRKTSDEQEETLMKMLSPGDVESGDISMIGQSDTSDSEAGSNGRGERALLDEKEKGGAVLPKGKGKHRGTKKGPRKIEKRA